MQEIHQNLLGIYNIMYNTCLVGIGYWGSKLARNFNNSEFFKLVSVVDKKTGGSTGAGREILITSIPNDGMMEGFDYEMIKLVSNSVSIPVIASGGAGNYQHILEAINAGADAVAAASIFHYTEQTPKEAKNYLYSNGIPVRK